MTHYFSNPERVVVLNAIACRWLGTPWCANSEACGPRGGVACHNLPRAILIECGALPESFPKIIGDPTATRHSRVSVMEPFLEARPEFNRVGVQASACSANGCDRLRNGNKLKLELQPGDLIGLRIYYCVDHLGLMISPTQFIHVLMHKQTCIDSLADPTWAARMGAVWRPVENSKSE